MKRILIFFVAISIILLAVTFGGCLEQGHPSQYFVVAGRVRDMYYNGLEGVDVYFCLDDQVLTTVSGKDGSYKFEYSVREGWSGEMRKKDYVSLDGSIYDFIAVNVSRENNGAIDVVCAAKGSEANIFHVNSYKNKITFHEDGLPLPHDYYNIGQYGGVTKNGETRLRGVEFFVGDYLVGISNEHGFDIANIHPDTLVTLKREGFSFVVLTKDGAVPLVAVVDGVEYPDSFIAPFQTEPFPINIRAVLKDGLTMDDIKL